MSTRANFIATAAVTAIAGALLAAGCGSSAGTSQTTAGASGVGSSAKGPGSGKPAVTLGTKNFTEQLILGQLYAQALRAKGFDVRLKSDIGASEVVDRELVAGKIDGYPEYTGTILSVLAHDSRRPQSEVQAYQRAATFERGRGAALLEMAPAEDKDVVITTPQYAASHRLATLGDLAPLGSSAALAGPPEFKTRFDGLVGLASEYGVTDIRFIPVPIASRYRVLADGRAQLVVGFTTDGNLSRGGFTPLRDPRNIFGFQNLAFVVRNQTLAREGAAFAQTINAVSEKLSTQALRVMNAAVDLDQQDPAAVARQFLGANGLA